MPGVCYVKPTQTSFGWDAAALSHVWHSPTCKAERNDVTPLQRCVQRCRAKVLQPLHGRAEQLALHSLACHAYCQISTGVGWSSKHLLDGAGAAAQLSSARRRPALVVLVGVLLMACLVCRVPCSLIASQHAF